MCFKTVALVLFYFILSCHHQNQTLPFYLSPIGDIVVQYDEMILAGAFNLHMDDTTTLANDFINVIEAFNLAQNVKSPTYHCGHTLYLIFSLACLI